MIEINNFDREKDAFLFKVDFTKINPETFKNITDKFKDAGFTYLVIPKDEDILSLEQIKG